MEPELTTITAQITLPKETIENFADANGYFEFIEDPEDSSKTVPNPDSRVDFIKKSFLERSLGWFISETGRQIRNAKNAEVQELVDQKREELRQGIIIS